MIDSVNLHEEMSFLGQKASLGCACVLVLCMDVRLSVYDFSPTLLSGLDFFSPSRLLLPQEAHEPGSPAGNWSLRDDASPFRLRRRETGSCNALQFLAFEAG